MNAELYDIRVLYLVDNREPGEFSLPLENTKASQSGMFRKMPSTAQSSRHVG